MSVVYRNFDLKLEAAPDGYHARVLDAPTGRAGHTFSLPTLEHHLETLLAQVGRGARMPDAAGTTPDDIPRTFGVSLFETVFGGELAECLLKSVDQMESQEQGLRLRLYLDEVPELLDIPWEYLYAPQLHRFLGLSRYSPLVRSVQRAAGTGPRRVGLPLRVLVMTSNPGSLKPDDMRQEWGQLVQACRPLSEAGQLELELLEQPSLPALRRHLGRGTYHILHIIGRGGFDGHSGAGTLLLDDSSSGTTSVNGEQLGSLLRDERLPLVVLQSTRKTQPSVRHPFARLSQRLVQHGIPAAITMQFHVGGTAAATLAHELYGALAEGVPLDEALAETRKAMYTEGDPIAWGAPALYLGAPDGHIFDIRAGEHGSMPATATPAEAASHEREPFQTPLSTPIAAHQPDEPPDEPSGALIGKVLQGRYEIEQKLGEGGFGAVYKAHDTRLGSTVAIKETFQTTPESVRQFEREARMLARLRHPSITSVTDYFSEAGNYYLVMEYIAGHNLGQYLAQQPDSILPEAAALDLLLPILNALEYLHSRRPPIIHRDIKPANIRISPEGGVYLVDFGIAKAYDPDSKTTIGARALSPGYSPIEQYGSTGTDTRADLYALGATLYQMLGGERPPDALQRAMQHDSIMPLSALAPSVSPQMEAIVKRLLAVQRENRYPSVKELRDDLQQLTTLQPCPRCGELNRAALHFCTRCGTALHEGEADTPAAESTAIISEPADFVSEPPAEPADFVSEPPAEPADLPAASDAGRTVISTPPPPLPDAVPPVQQPEPPAPAPTPSRRFGPGLVVGVVLALLLLGGGAAVASGLLPIFGGDDPQPSATSTPTDDDDGAEAATAEAATAEAAEAQAATAEAAEAQAATTTAEAAEAQAATATAEVEGATATAETIVQARTATAAAFAEGVASVRTDAAQRAARHQDGGLGRATTAVGAEVGAEIGSTVLADGYEANRVTIAGLEVLRANPSSPVVGLWSRDLEYATRGYSYPLGDMSVFRSSLALLLDGVRGDGVVPEAIFRDRPAVYDATWDSMPNLIGGVSIYVAKTGDYDFYRRHRDTLQRVGGWIASLDTDGDGLPNENPYPYGYYNSVSNSTLHTYAIAKFYGAYRNLAALDNVSGFDGAPWSARAASMRQSFHRDFDQGGYWLPGQTWPIAWYTGSDGPVERLETFGVFEALHSGLIGPQDGERYTRLMATLNEHLPDLIDQDVGPMRLMWEGYEPWMRREVVPPVPEWMLDASAPWIVGLAAPAFAEAGYPDAALQLANGYRQTVQRTSPRLPQLAAGPGARYGAGTSPDYSTAWDNAAWFLALYEGHYGLRMYPAYLEVQPNPFTEVPDDGVQNFTYQGAHLTMVIEPPDAAAGTRTYRLQVDMPTVVRLLPIGGTRQLRVNGGPLQDEARLVLQPGEIYDVVCE